MMPSVGFFTSILYAMSLLLMAAGIGTSTMT